MASGSQPQTGLSLCHTITLAQRCAVTRQSTMLSNFLRYDGTFITVGGHRGLKVGQYSLQLRQLRKCPCTQYPLLEGNSAYYSVWRNLPQGQ